METGVDGTLEINEPRSLDETIFRWITKVFRDKGATVSQLTNDLEKNGMCTHIHTYMIIIIGRWKNQIGQIVNYW